MTTELTKAAQQTLEPHQIAQLVNKLRDIAREFHAHDCLRELISREINDAHKDLSKSILSNAQAALTQRPAAQEVASYFSYGEDAGYLEHATAEAAREQAKADIRGYRNDAMHDNEWPSEVDSVCWGVVLQKATAVDNSEEAGQESFDYELGPAPQQATPEPVGEHDMAGMLERGAKAWAGVDPQDLRAGGVAPEPVGETWGWAIEDKHGVAQAIRPARKEFFGCVQSSEPFTAEDVSKMDCEWAGLAPHRIVTLFAHPAPGVPEGFALVPIEPTPEMENAFRQAFTNQLHKRRNQWGRAKHTMSAEGAGLRAMLAAATQAKGGEHA